MPMLYASMWTVLYAWMKGLMKLQNFVELERLLLSGQLGLCSCSSSKGNVLDYDEKIMLISDLIIFFICC